MSQTASLLQPDEAPHGVRPRSFVLKSGPSSLQDDDAPRGVRPRPSIYTYHRYPNPIPLLKRDQVQLREPPLDRRQRVYLAVISGPGVGGALLDAAGQRGARAPAQDALRPF